MLEDHQDPEAVDAAHTKEHSCYQEQHLAYYRQGDGAVLSTSFR